MPNPMPDLANDPDALRRLAARMRAEADQIHFSKYFRGRLRRRAAEWEDKAALIEAQRKAERKANPEPTRKE
jgi:hypothetical protein